MKRIYCLTKSSATLLLLYLLCHNDNMMWVEKKGIYRENDIIYMHSRTCTAMLRCVDYEDK